ncbi:hypothetical protein M670_03951 [Schinkia azotoformans MEV2011]|uniref:Uncharacterized protein n=1 Tax=Schinkia azotoformans MEV2011 TaxID=1348973 RepID=A0A072NGM9_SCHAZ|nr:hypothetical protein [Schinkia azotoformans]KEF36869.1 hypothetical protein M670_03951 [Schinkia azotoformans MEV2011]MEC1695244.1 hypothetical protein [Schinkia azotoformans]MEC1723701.1 hypothetical protein [Schinkia azotoformans]MEC1772679.1 hypothetical protein [Schinkia azotoformans]MEC1778482.1 hypothetical protein [Schinkia azotoformans]
MAIKKIITMVSIMALLLVTLVNPGEPSAKVESVQKSNFQMIKSTDMYLEYSYDENGKSFKIIEEFDADFKGVSSEIYIKNSEGNYELFSEQKSTIEDNNLVIETKKDNKINTEKFEFQTPQINSEELIKIDSKDAQLLSGEVTINAVTDWIYYDTSKYSDAVKKFTIGAISILIASRIPWATAADLTRISTLAYNIFAPNLYYTILWYYKWDGNVPVAEMKIAYVYSDSQRTNQLGNAVLTTKYMD